MALARMHSDWMLIVSDLVPRPSPTCSTVKCNTSEEKLGKGLGMSWVRDCFLLPIII